jgi:hypothetical protein
MSGKGHVLAVIAALGIIAVTGCSSSSSSSTGSTTSNTTPVTSSSAVAKAQAQVTACIQKTGTIALLTSSGRSELVNCIKGLVPPAKQQAFQDCLTNAAVNDKLWTSAGRTTFRDTSLPNCLNAVA